MLCIPQVWIVVWNPRNACKYASFSDAVQPYRTGFRGAIVGRFAGAPGRREAPPWKQV
jgi:hypothetical protein